VKRLPQADLILALDQSGRVIEQGTFADLSLAGSYIESLQVKLEEQSREEETHESPTKLADAPKAGPAAATVVLDQGRKTGDWTTYKYYSRALGPPALLIFVGFVTVNETFAGMTCEFSSII
jgi:ATP-binding cassette subfamily C (CFTR/MRP) protein 1